MLYCVLLFSLVIDVAAVSTALVSPPVLFFGLGLGATAVRSDLRIPEQISKFLSLYLVTAIGFKGGVALRAEGWSTALGLTMVGGIALGIVIPFIARAVLLRLGRVGPVDAAAIGAHYGSVSLVTFLTAQAFLERMDIPAEGFMVAVLAIMESPSIIVGVALANRAGTGAAVPLGRVLAGSVTHGSLLLLVGATVIGLLSGARGMADVEGFLVTPFTGLLVLFLLDMGLLAGRRLGAFRTYGWRLAACGIILPLVGGVLGGGGGALIGLSTGGTTLLAVLAASASYIAAPAAIREAVPDADPGLSIGLALGVTFPFNLVVGIPLFAMIASALT